MCVSTSASGTICESGESAHVSDDRKMPRTCHTHTHTHTFFGPCVQHLPFLPCHRGQRSLKLPTQSACVCERTTRGVRWSSDGGVSPFVPTATVCHVTWTQTCREKHRHHRSLLSAPVTSFTAVFTFSTAQQCLFHLR